MNTKMLLALCGVVVFENTMLANQRHPFSPGGKHHEQPPVHFDGNQDKQNIQRPIPVKNKK